MILKFIAEETIQHHFEVTLEPHEEVQENDFQAIQHICNVLKHQKSKAHHIETSAYNIVPKSVKVIK